MAFKMRSGNGPLAFKNMGSSPALQLSDVAKQTENMNETKVAMLNSNTPGRNLESEAKGRADKAKAKVDATRGTERGQVKKQGKLDKIQARQDKKFQNKKGKASDKVINKMNKIGTLEDKQKKHEAGSKKYNSLQKRIDKNQKKLTDAEKKEEKFEGETSSKETKRETRLKKEVSMTPEEYKANQAKKKQDFQDAANRVAISIDPKTSSVDVANFDKSVRSRGSQAILDAERESLTRARNDEQVETLKGGKKDLKKDQNPSQTEEGDPNTETQASKSEKRIKAAKNK